MIKPKLHRFFLLLAYQGNDYRGWQQQPCGNTIQDRVEKALGLLGFPVPIVGSGRTDAGVHAVGQVAHLDLPATIDKNRCCHQINALLPATIVVNGLIPVIPSAHARFSAIWRSYTYTLSQKRDPFNYQTTHYVPYQLNLIEMQEATALLIGEHDFAAFCKEAKRQRNHQVHIFEAFWKVKNHRWHFYLRANRFLYGMVRALAGTLVEVGRGRLSIVQFKALLETKKRGSAIHQLPARGLCLMRVVYPACHFLATS